MPRYASQARAGAGAGARGPVGGQGVATVRSDVRSFVRGRGAVRGSGRAGGRGAGGLTRRRSEGKAGRDPSGCVGAQGHFPGGRGRPGMGSPFGRRRAPASPPDLERGGGGSERRALGSLRARGEGARICGFGSQMDRAAGARGPARRPLPLRQVFVQRPLCVREGVGAGLLAWRFPSIVTGQ